MDGGRRQQDLPRRGAVVTRDKLFVETAVVGVQVVLIRGGHGHDSRSFSTPTRQGHNLVREDRCGTVYVMHILRLYINVVTRQVHFCTVHLFWLVKLRSHKTKKLTLLLNIST